VVKCNTVVAPIVLILVLLTTGSDLGAFDLQISDGKLSVDADRVPLQDFLRVLSYNGIAVQIDPKINPVISATFNNRDLEEGLKSILKPHNHVFVWKLLPSLTRQVKRPYQLAAIHVFRPGHKELMAAIEAPDPASQEAPETDTDVIIQNDKIYVPVTLAYQDRQVETTLVFDTGASGIVLHQNVAEQLGIDQTTPSTAKGVGGIEIETRLARLQYVIVGPHKKENMGVSIVAYQTPSEASDDLFNGLLGMGFIKGLSYHVDFDNQVIQW
jgi:predicted aspartyl protease